MVSLWLLHIRQHSVSGLSLGMLKSAVRQLLCRPLQEMVWRKGTADVSQPQTGYLFATTPFTCSIVTVRPIGELLIYYVVSSSLRH